MKKYFLSAKVEERILTDNEFSLAFSLFLGKKQDTVFRLVKRKSDLLRLPESVEFYKQNGILEEEIFEIIENTPVE